MIKELDWDSLIAEDDTEQSYQSVIGTFGKN